MQGIVPCSLLHLLPLCLAPRNVSPRVGKPSSRREVGTGKGKVKAQLHTREGEARRAQERGGNLLKLGHPSLMESWKELWLSGVTPTHLHLGWIQGVRTWQGEGGHEGQQRVNLPLPANSWGQPTAGSTPRIEKASWWAGGRLVLPHAWGTQWSPGARQAGTGGSWQQRPILQDLRKP